MVQSVRTIKNPEFINLQTLDINPLMSSCEIKVFYVGENRNGSYISKEIATDMAKSLRGAPIVGYYKDKDEDFSDHGQQVIIDDEGIKFNCLTKPYGFVSPDAKVWFQEFEETDDFGNTILREYMMTTGYLWTGQFKECQSVLNNGKGQSMEFDEETLQGHWSKNTKNNMEFFIIDDAIFSKLCILGDGVEPCFEGANVTAPEISKTFTKVDNEFKYTLFSMMNELKYALKGGNNMDMEVNTVDTQQEEVLSTTESVDTPINDTSTEFTKSEEDEKKDKEETSKDEDKKEEEDKDKKSDYQCKDDEDEEKKKNYSLLQQEYDTLKEELSQLKAVNAELLQFKAKIEDEKKTNLINSFYMLSDADKKDVIDNKATYSLDEIEAKLSIIYTKQKMALDAQEKETTEEEKTLDVMTYNINTDETDIVPEWIKAVRETEKALKF